MSFILHTHRKRTKQETRDGEKKKRKYVYNQKQFLLLLSIAFELNDFTLNK